MCPTKLDHYSGEYQPITMEEYVKAVVKLIKITPKKIIYHRLTGTASKEQLLAPAWCCKKWQVLNAIERELAIEIGA